ncbi:FkbM family methyltransferase, partial [Mycobacterium tuberculosis]
MKSLKLARFIARSAAFEVSRRYSERDLKHQFVKQLKSRRVDV